MLKNMGPMPLPIGVQNFAELRSEGYYYVDKSELIADILDSKAKTSLFTRPRRFGKSLNLSMLDAFFNVRYGGNTWFEGLRISARSDLEPHRNAYPVILVDLKDLNAGTYDSFLKLFRDKISELYRTHAEIMDSEKLLNVSREEFRAFYFGRADEEMLSKSLVKLSNMLKAHHGKDVVILIDEYDSPVNDAKDRKTGRAILNFLGLFLSSALKGNDSLKLAVVTGVMRISKESIFSGLNNLSVNDIFSREFDEMFGFTDSEVERICSDYGHPEKFEEAREWYDGYRFGDAKVYNPWSVLNYVNQGFEAGLYWAGTSGNSIIDDLLCIKTEDIAEDLAALASGGTVECEIAQSTTYSETTRNPAAIYAVMAASGYLSAAPTRMKGLYALSMPNREIYQVFGDKIGENLPNKAMPTIRAFCEALGENDRGTVERRLTDLMTDYFSVRSFRDESSYETMLLTMLFHLDGRYESSTEREGGEGYYDIMLRNVKGDGPHILIELKKTDARKEETARELAEAAIRQIKTREYFRGLEGDAILYGIAFRGKEAFVASETLSLPAPPLPRWFHISTFLPVHAGLK